MPSVRSGLRGCAGGSPPTAIWCRVPSGSRSRSSRSPARSRRVSRGSRRELAAGRAAGEDIAGQLRACAAEEAQIQALLRERGESVTSAAVRAQQARDHSADADHELVLLAERLGLPAEAAEEPARARAGAGAARPHRAPAPAP